MTYIPLKNFEQTEENQNNPLALQKRNVSEENHQIFPFCSHFKMPSITVDYS